MPTVLVDSNVLLDILIPDPDWEEWSSTALAEAALPDELEREGLPWDAAFLAGKAFLTYRRRGGTKRVPLPDFYIGAHAAVRGYTLLTRDATRYRSYFPALSLIPPPEASD